MRVKDAHGCKKFILQSEIPVIHNIDSAILAAIEPDRENFSMKHWHSTVDRDGYHYSDSCGTAHCRAGWAIVLAGEAGRALEGKVGSQTAGTLIYRKSRCWMPAPEFIHDTDSQALTDMRACAAHEQEYDEAAQEDKQRTKQRTKERNRMARNLARRQLRAKAKELAKEALQTAARDLELVV
jgi:hypothetical protein